ncbi:MAG: glycosyltransferase family 2 protein [Burkholderiales bacterium]
MRALTILIPALDEEQKVAPTVEEVLAAGRRLLDRFEVIVVDDGSRDRTGEIADALAKSNPEVRVIHNPERRGVGWAFWEGIAQAKFDRLTVVPGDHAYNISGIERLFSAVGSADLVISYRTNQADTRQRRRVILSTLYQRLVGLIFGFRLKDFHSTVVYPVPQIREMGMRSVGYTYQLEVLVKLLRRGMSYVEVPVTLNPSGKGTSAALRPKTFFDVLWAIWRLMR